VAPVDAIPPVRVEKTIAEWQRQWSAAASAAKRRIVLWRTAVLTLGVAGAVLVTLAAQLADLSSAVGKTLAVVGAGAVGVVPLINSRMLSHERLREYAQVRSVSEALKSELYRYLTRTGAYAGDDAPQKLLETAQAARQLAGNVAPSTANVGPHEATPPRVADIDSYIQRRVEDQIAYYRPRARRYEGRLSQFRAVEFAIAVGAVVLGAAAAVFDVEPAAAWVPVLTTIGAALLAHAAAAHYSDDSIAFTRTADRLEFLREMRRAGHAGNVADADFVDACEDAISTENQGWMAKWSSEEAESQT
jgi:hypothetical protein